ncbi:MAG: UDP-3-O-(3-hydroxymyristoyl)glucosamine N-acyltransferase [Zoogloea sp.]|nr:UDP-3-O-(3-hydroxymyristoyl)glucosamine N-acyltransferase [Zoogloea sp.]
MVTTLGALVAQLGGDLIGDPALEISRIASLENATAGDIAFLSNPKLQPQLDASGASAFILGPDAAGLTDRPRIVTRNPYLYFARTAQVLNPPKSAAVGVHPSAVVDSALPATVSVGPHVSIGRDCMIGEGVVIGPGCHLGDRVVIGAGSRLNAHVVIYDGCLIGERAIVHSGAVIGADGFGFARDADGSWVKIPQIGRVVIGNDVEIGANTTIDRGALDDTVIADGVKLDNLIQVAHNVHIGMHTAMAGQSGIAGSSRIGARCMIAGQAGISGHLKVGDDIVVSAATVIAKSVDKPGMYTGMLPQMPHGDWVKNFAHLRRLDSMADRIRQLEKRLAEVEKKQ